MAFTQGQLYFAITFLIIFVIVMIFAYRSDLKGLSAYKKDGFVVLAFIVVVMTIFYGIIKFLSS